MNSKFYEISRRNMVNNQVITNRVNNQDLIEALLSIEKERFVPKEKLPIVYSDSDIEFKSKRYLIKTFVFAKMIEFSKVKINDSLLIIGCLTGYSVAVLSKISGYVFGVENDNEIVKKANKNLSDIGCHNCSVSFGKLSEGLKKNSPFDKIFIEGAVQNIPIKIISQLKEGGEIFSIFRKRNSIIGQFMVGLKINGHVSYRHLFDANAQYLDEFSVDKNDFNFKD